VVQRLAARAPLLLIVEDLHWADRSTRHLLAFLAASLRSGPVLLLLTFRSDELDRLRPATPTPTTLLRPDRSSPGTPSPPRSSTVPPHSSTTTTSACSPPQPRSRPPAAPTNEPGRSSWPAATPHRPATPLSSTSV
jgi:hypothetical protein